MGRADGKQRRLSYVEIDGVLDVESQTGLLDWLASLGIKARFVSKNEVIGSDLDELRNQVVIQSAEIETILDNVDEIQEELEAAIDRGDDLEDEIEEMMLPSSRRPPVHFKLPEEREGLTHKFNIGGRTEAEGYVTVGTYPESTDVGEIFVTMNPFNKGKTDGPKPTVEDLEERLSDLYAFQKGILDQLALAVSVGLQRGIPLEVYVNKFIHTKFPPDGFTQNRDIPRASSVIDYIFRWIGGKFIDADKYMPNRRKGSEGEDV
jgi:hypothetical protein